METPLPIISRYNEDLSWVKEYFDWGIIYNKGGALPTEFISYSVVESENLGGNQRDIARFCYLNWDYLVLPSFVFLQGYPFDHCKKEVFDKIIENDFFTPIEYYGIYAANSFEARDSNGGFMEINNSWYIQAHNQTHNQTCFFSSFDEFMHFYFADYTHLDWIRFTPGSQYIVTREDIQRYPKTFWKSIYELLNTKKSPTEGHIVERALYYIFTGKYKLKDGFYE